ncbi:uncharacterized protein [Diadema setosum]|uniref:uncharacterized protein n=1 Tax=Diadema setosum TaxID=31175 RepID=UPI003B3BE213
MTDQADRTLWVGNLEPRVTDEILFELFLQAGPVKHVNIAKDKEGRQKNFAFVEFKHDVSVPYAMQLMGGLPIFGRALRLQFRSGSKHQNTPPGMGTPPMMPPPRLPPGIVESQGNGILGDPPRQGQGAATMTRSASAPGRVLGQGQVPEGHPMHLLGIRAAVPIVMPGNMMSPGQMIGLPPGTPFSQGAAFQGLPVPDRVPRLEDSPQRNTGHDRSWGPSHSSPLTSRHSSYNSPERGESKGWTRGDVGSDMESQSDRRSQEDKGRNFDRSERNSRKDKDNYDRGADLWARDRSRQDRYSRRDDRDYSRDPSQAYRGSGSPHGYGNDEPQQGGHFDELRDPDRGRRYEDYSGHGGRESRSNRDYQGREPERYRDRSGSRHDQDRRSRRSYHLGH